MATRLVGAPEITVSPPSSTARIARGEISRVEVMFGRYRQGGGPKSSGFCSCRSMVACSHQATASTPLHNLAPRPLLEKLIAEYVFALLTEAAVESISSENAARFAAMESRAQERDEEALQLRQSAQQARQTEITAELLDLITGAEAMQIETGGRSPRGIR